MCTNIIGMLAITISICRPTLPSFLVEPGPLVKRTSGAVWPLPDKMDGGQLTYTLDEKFEFILNEACTVKEDTKCNCPSILDSLTSRYRTIILQNRLISPPSIISAPKETIKSVQLDWDMACHDEDYPSLGVNESYQINVGAPTTYLYANTIWGLMRAVETFSQIVVYNGDGTRTVRSWNITDEPQFAHRGLLLDTSRHYFPVPVILKTLDAMSYNKLNVFHWHIVDDQSFPYQSSSMPELSAKGAYQPHMIYNASDIKVILEYARQRGIRVIPEWDSPGHTAAIGRSHPNILTQCYDQNGNVTGPRGPLNPIKTEAVTFMANLINESKSIFPDAFVHLGGDEVEASCWKSNPDIQNFMKLKGLTDINELHSYYLKNLLHLTDQLNLTYIFWEEVFTNNIKIPKDSIIHIWKNNGVDVLKKALNANYKIIFSAGFYLDHLRSGGDWLKFYNNEAFSSKTKISNLVLGGEACMWSEVVNQYNLEPRVWPRASAVAEKLWTKRRHVQDAPARLEEHTCRLNQRSINAQPPNGPGFC